MGWCWALRHTLGHSGNATFYAEDLKKCPEAETDLGGEAGRTLARFFHERACPESHWSTEQAEADCGRAWHRGVGAGVGNAGLPVSPLCAGPAITAHRGTQGRHFVSLSCGFPLSRVKDSTGSRANLIGVGISKRIFWKSPGCYGQTLLWVCFCQLGFHSRVGPKSPMTCRLSPRRCPSGGVPV